VGLGLEELPHGKVPFLVGLAEEVQCDVALKMQERLE